MSAWEAIESSSNKYVSLCSVKGLTFYTESALCSWPVTWYKNTLLLSKKHTGTRQTNKITILDDVSSLFVLSQCVLAHQQGVFVPRD